MLVGLGLFVLGLLGITTAPPSLSAAENLLHLGSGSLFIAGAALLDRPNQLRGFLFGLGMLLVLAKALMVVARGATLGLHIPLVAIICLVAGVGSLLIAPLVGRTPPEG